MGVEIAKGVGMGMGLDWIGSAGRGLDGRGDVL